MRLAIKFAYDGRKFHGYARQPGLKTVEGELLQSLIRNGFILNAKESFFRASSRTDKNVSALGNVVSFNTESTKKQILNNLSSEYIVVYGIKEVGPQFNPRHAKMRHYRYYLPIANLHVDKIIKASNCFTGNHNFSNFARLESFRDPIRSIDNIVLSLENETLIIDFYAQTFLWHQIRRIVSALIKIGNNKINEDQIIKALDNPDESVDFGVAPAEPLILQDIIFDFEFEYDKKSLEKVYEFEKNFF